MDWSARAWKEVPPSDAARSALRRLGSRSRPPRRRRTGMVLTRLYPQDKTQNASGLRRTLSSIANGSATPMPTDVEPATGLPPLLVRMLDQQAATGLPPAYLPKDEEGETP